MTTIQCPQCGAKQDEGTHCDICGASLDSSQRPTKDPYKEPDKTAEDLGESPPNADEKQLATAKDKETTGVIIKKKNTGLLFLLVILVCIGLSVTLSYILNYLPNSSQNVENVQTEAVEPPVEPEVKVPPAADNTDFENLKKKLKAEEQQGNTHDMIVEKVAWQSHLLFNKEDANNTDHVQSEIESLINKNQCNKNSEDIIIAIEGNVENAQKLLKKIKHKQFYLSLLNKHLGSRPCNRIDYNARVDWSERENPTFLNNSKWRNNPQNTITTCSNDNLKSDDNILNISMEFNVLNEPNEKPSLREISLGWGDPADKYFRFYDDFVIDRYLLVENSEKIHNFENFKIHENGRITLFNSAYEIKNFIKKTADVNIVYGRFIPDPTNNATYFVLSYRSYNISNTYSCHDYQKYKRILLPREYDSRPRDAQIDLPF